MVIKHSVQSCNDTCRGTGLVGVLIGCFLGWTLESLRQTDDSSLNHENTPTGDRESNDMDTVWEERQKITAINQWLHRPSLTVIGYSCPVQFSTIIIDIMLDEGI